MFNPNLNRRSRGINIPGISAITEPEILSSLKPKSLLKWMVMDIDRPVIKITILIISEKIRGKIRIPVSNELDSDAINTEKLEAHSALFIIMT